MLFDGRDDGGKGGARLLLLIDQTNARDGAGLQPGIDRRLTAFTKRCRVGDNTPGARRMSSS